MENQRTLQERVGSLFGRDKLAILLEIAVVFVPLYVLLLLSVRLGGEDFVRLGGGLALLGGPLVNLGLIVTIVIFWFVSKMRGSTWSDFGLARPKSWVRTILWGVGLTFGIGIAFSLLVPLIQLAFPLPQSDHSRFDILAGNLPNLILNVIAAWFTAGFLEELLWRGYGQCLQPLPCLSCYDGRFFFCEFHHERL